ncbi:MAG: hypothetical protein HY658_06375 [Actinobacteria bacterium]|nr:hypothetical protein [Actinomycetota bacterium]
MLVRTSILVAAVAALSTAPARGADAVSVPLPAGTLTVGASQDPSCPVGFGCQSIVVSCPGVSSDQGGTIAVGEPGGAPRGVVAFFDSGAGDDWWGMDEPEGASLLADLRTAGFRVVLVRWKGHWLASGAGQDTGPDALACRPATTIRHVHDTLYAPLLIDPAEAGRCGFCLVGSSGGASAIAYALSHHGLDQIVDAIVPTGGPPHVALAKGCLRDPSQEAYWYEGASVRAVDLSYGFMADGPCLRNDPSFRSRWAATSVDAPGADLAYPTTRVAILVGEQDRIQPHSRDYLDLLLAAGTPASLEVVPGAGHDIVAVPAGHEAIERALLAGGGSAPPPDPATGPFLLEVARVGKGTVTSAPPAIRCGWACSAALPAATTLALEARPARGWAFAGWSGDCVGAGSCSVTMDGPCSVTATFVKVRSR